MAATGEFGGNVESDACIAAGTGEPSERGSVYAEAGDGGRGGGGGGDGGGEGGGGELAAPESLRLD
jgi:hypothetical protein